MLSNGIHIGRRGGVRLTGGGGPWWLAGGIDPATVVAVYQPKGAASLAASYVNLANPGTNDAAPGVAPTFNTATGWTFNGTTQYLTTGIVPLLNWTLIVRFSGVANNGILAGSGLSTALFAISPQRGAGGIVRYSYGAGTSEIAPGMTAGVLGIAGGNRYRHGAADGSFSALSSSAINAIQIGCVLNDVLAAFGFVAASVQAVHIANTTLAAGQMAALTTAMNAL